MNLNDQRVTELIAIFQELADTSGGMERTSIWPSLTVIDASPANLGTDYIIIEDVEGFYIPALKVPGITYNNGDLVNVLFIKGSEPIAFQQGPGSSGGSGGSGGWPFDAALTVSTTAPTALYDNLASAVGAAVSGDVIMLDSETFSSSTTQNLSTSITIEGMGQGQTIITSSVSNAPVFDITADDITVVFRNLTIQHTGGGAEANCIFSNNAANIIIDNCRIEILSGSPVIAAPIKANNGVWTLRNGTYVYAPHGTNKYAIYNDASVGILYIHIEASCSVWGLNNDVRAIGNAIIRSYGAIFISNMIGIAGSASFAGWYTWGTNGITYFIHTSYSGTPIAVGINQITIPTGASISAGIWLIDESTGLRTKYSTIAAAIAAAATGDSIKLEAKTYTITGSTLAVDKSITIEGDGAGTTIITSALSNSPTLDITADNVTFRNLTIAHTGTGAIAGPIATDNANLMLDNVLIDKSSGASTTSYGVWLYGAGSIRFKNGTRVVCTAGTIKYGVMHTIAAGSIIIENGEVGGDTADLYTDQASATCLLALPKLTNNLISWAGTLAGVWQNSDGVLYSPESNDVASPHTFRPNYNITASVASNNLTVALKTIDNEDASSIHPIAVRIGDVVATITAALSTTKNAGTNWCNAGSAELATQSVDYFVYLINETGGSAGIKLGFSRIPWALTMSDFVNTTTNEKYIAGNWTNFNANDTVTVIGRFAATLSAGAGYTWSGAGTITNYSIFESRWLSFTPTVTSGTGSITTVGSKSGFYKIALHTMYLLQSTSITTNGTGASWLNVTAPFNAAATAVLAGREFSVGNMLQGVSSANSNVIVWRTYNNAYPVGSGYSMTGGPSPILI